MTEKYGADGFRLGMMMQMRLESQELRFDERVCDQARRFNTKLWNALQYIVTRPQGLPRAAVLPPADRLTVADKWILTELHACVAEVTAALDGFAMGTAANTLHDFGWYKFCDWYLESTKIEAAHATRGPVLSFVLNTLVRALHPIEPFVTEEIWQILPHDGQTIVTASWPDLAEIPTFPRDAAMFAAFMTAVERIRNAKAELGLRPGQNVRLRSAPLPAQIVSLFAAFVRGELEADPLRAEAPDGAADEATVIARLAQVEAAADPGVLRERYTREVVRLEEEVNRLERKLGNPQFISKANPGLVAGERAKLAAYQRDLDRARSGLGEA
jgi:valyl-tRNA synthetase